VAEVLELPALPQQLLVAIAETVMLQEQDYHFDKHREIHARKILE
jgi:hypothetical protein